MGINEPLAEENAPAEAEQAEVRQQADFGEAKKAKLAFAGGQGFLWCYSRIACQGAERNAKQKTEKARSHHDFV